MKPVAIAMLLLSALALAGCKKPPAYVGTYKIVLTPQMQAQAEALSKMSQNNPNGTDMGAAMSGMTITLNADGTAEIADAAVKSSSKGTYKLVGDKLTVTPGTPNGPSPFPMECVYSAKDETITWAPGNFKITYKKE